MKIKERVTFKVTVIGTGATGSHFVSNFTQIYSNFENEITSLLLIDGDHFEEKNLRNQKCLMRDINNNKADVLSERFSRIYPNININSYNQYIKNKNDLEEILSYRNFLNDEKYSNNQQVEVIIGTIDNDKTRSIIDELIKDFKKLNKNYIYIDSGNSTDSMEGQVYINYNLDYYTFEDGNRGESLENKLLTEIFPDILNSKEEDIEKLIGCAVEVNEKPQLLPTNLMAANLLIQICYKIMVNRKIPEDSLYVFDAKNFTSTFVKT